MRYWSKLIGIPLVILILLVFAGYLSFRRAVFIIEHPLCFGSCPAYTVWIFRGGTILYCGDQNVAHISLHLGHMDPAQVQQFATQYAALLEHLPPIPVSDLIMTDVSERSITYLQDGKSHHMVVKDTDGPRVALIDAFVDQVETAAQVP